MLRENSEGIIALIGDQNQIDVRDDGVNLMVIISSMNTIYLPILNATKRNRNIVLALFSAWPVTVKSFCNHSLWSMQFAEYTI